VTNGTEFRGVITDWGGVLTTPILTTVQAWIEADGIDWDSYRAVMRAWVTDAYGPNGSRNPVHALERGECSDAEFEEALAARLLRVDGGSVLAAGLLQRMFAASVEIPAMYELIRAVRAAGLRTALLSNSWGGTEYPRADFPSLFDAVVISGECGMRKPEAEIFRHAADLLGLPPEQCVFIDDIEANIAAAEACGMTGVHHVEAAQTAAAIEDLLGVRLGATGRPGGGPAGAEAPAEPATGNTMR
jgi:putative hydrolase of the HAD superfamily